jgi:hypothetical protein
MTMADIPTMPIRTAAVSWQDSGGLHLRVYSSDGYNVIERCADAGTDWTAGSFTAPGSDVSATCWQDDGGVHIRVYCTAEDATTEWCFDAGSGWSKGSYTV